MGARPPQNDTSEPEVIEFGIAALSARLEAADVAFPTTSSELVDAVDNTAIPIDGSGNTVELQVALDAVPKIKKRDVPLPEPPGFDHRATASGRVQLKTPGEI